MGEIYDIALSYFMDRGWPVEEHEDQPILRFEYEGENGRWFCYARAREGADQLIFASVLSEKVPEDKRPAVAEFLNRANYGLNIGNFEMDFDDGEVRYKTSVDVSHARLTLGLIDPLVNASLVAMDDYLPGIRSVTAGEATPIEAIEQVYQEQDEFDLIL